MVDDHVDNHGEVLTMVHDGERRLMIMGEHMKSAVKVMDTIRNPFMVVNLRSSLQWFNDNDQLLLLLTVPSGWRCAHHLSASAQFERYALNKWEDCGQIGRERFLNRSSGCWLGREG